MATNQKVKTSLTLEERINVIKENEIKETSHRKLTKKYNVGKTQIQTTIGRKVEYLRAYEELMPSKRYRIKGNLKYPEIDKAIKEWFDLARENNIPISGPIIQEKAKLIAETLGIHEFKGSDGWLHSFRSRHAIDFGILSGESADVDKEVINVWKARIAELCEGYEDINIFNCDETGLYFKGLPNNYCEFGKTSNKNN